MIGNVATPIPTRVGGAAGVVGGTALVASASLEAAVGGGADVPGTLPFTVVLGLLALSGALLATATLGAVGYMTDRGGRPAAYGLVVACAAHLLLAVGALVPFFTSEMATWTTPSGYVRLTGVVVAVVGVTLLSVTLWRQGTVRTAAVIWLWTLPLVVLFVTVGGWIQNATGADLLWTFLGVQLGVGWLILGHQLWLDSAATSDAPGAA